ncbi:MAG: alpha-galactosidase, partial [Lachnospiraceae bacterium]|nr:alpha-galactosidase [Lachnospiraceae bacterium]
AVGEGEDTKYIFDAFLPESPDADTFVYSIPMKVTLKSGNNLIRIMNHRRQENTLISYTKVFESLRDAAPEKDLVLSLCEWVKTQPHEWGYKVGHSWRIPNDITFQVGSDGNPGNGSWNSDYTTGVTAQYDKAVIMDEFSDLDKGWNDPDMLMVGMNGLDETMNRTHFTLWCMLNAPLMLGLDLRRVEKGDAIHKIISRKELVALNQDPLGIQAKRVYTTAKCDAPDKDYIRDNERVDVLVKPLADGSLAVTFVNLGEKSYKDEINISAKDLIKAVKSKAVQAEIFENADTFEVIDLWTEDKEKVTDGICVKDLAPHDQKTFRIYPAE